MSPKYSRFGVNRRADVPRSIVGAEVLPYVYPTWSAQDLRLPA